MDEPFLPWSSMVLLGMWAVALTFWIAPSVHREIRLWSGLLTLVYIVLIFVALGGGPRTKVATGTLPTSLVASDVFLIVVGATCLAASVGALGRFSSRCRQSFYVVLTLANAGVCLILRQPEVAVGLFVVAGLTAWPLFRGWTRQGPFAWQERLAEFTCFIDSAVPSENRGAFGLVGVLTGAMVFTVLGTISYSLHVETVRATSSLRDTALPSRERLDRVLGRQKASVRETSVMDLALGTRSDLVVLMATIVFLYLAMSMADVPQPMTHPLATMPLGSEDPLSEETP